MLDGRQPIIGFSCILFSFNCPCNFRVFSLFLWKNWEIRLIRGGRPFWAESQHCSTISWHRGAESLSLLGTKKKKLLICFIFVTFLFRLGSYTHKEKTSKAIKEEIIIFMRNFKGVVLILSFPFLFLGFVPIEDNV